MFHLKALKAVLLFHKLSFWVPILGAEGPYLIKYGIRGTFYCPKSSEKCASYEQ